MTREGTPLAPCGACGRPTGSGLIHNGAPVCSGCYEAAWDAAIDAEADRFGRALRVLLDRPPAPTNPPTPNPQPRKD